VTFAVEGYESRPGPRQSVFVFPTSYVRTSRSPGRGDAGASCGGDGLSSIGRDGRLGQNARPSGFCQNSYTLDTVPGRASEAIFRAGALRGDRLPCRGSSHTSDPPRASSRFCIHPAHGRGSHFGTGIDLGASRTSLFSTGLLSGRTPSSRASLIQRAAASSQCKRRRSSSAMIALRQQSSARPRYHSVLVGDMTLKTASDGLLIQASGRPNSGLLSATTAGPPKSATGALCASRIVRLGNVFPRQSSILRFGSAKRDLCKNPVVSLAILVEPDAAKRSITLHCLDRHLRPARVQLNHVTWLES
jgi:hypothetical protein